MPPSPAKTALRRALRARRSAQYPAAHPSASFALTAQIQSHPAWQSARAIAAFVGVRGEPDTRPLLEAALAEGRSLWLPRVLHGTDGLSELVLTTSLDHLAPAGFGLLEPSPQPDEHTLSTVGPDSGLDLILVPGLAFSSAGARIGFGAGHYDRLLAPCADHPSPVRMGLCFHAFFDPPEGPIPTADHDITMHWIATERAVHRGRLTEPSSR